MDYYADEWEWDWETNNWKEKKDEIDPQARTPTNASRNGADYLTVYLLRALKKFRCLEYLTSVPNVGFFSLFNYSMSNLFITII